jgi:beta-N-acetylhexosaminidase
MKLSINLILLLSIVANCVAFDVASKPRAQARQKFEPSEKAWKWADKQLKKMSVEEKVGQLVHVGVNARFANQDSSFFKALKRDVVENKIGGIIFFGAPIYETSILANRMQELAEIPLLTSLDAETGIGMRFEDAINFPWAMAMAATGNPDYARRVGVVTGREAKAIGIYHVYSPVLDVNNNADNPVINVRSFGEDPEDVAKYGIAFIDGLQSTGVLATAKHFPGHGDTNVDSHRGLPIIELSRDRMEKVELLPFRRAIDAGVGSVMIAHIALPQIDGEQITPLKQFIQGDAEHGAEIVKQQATIPATLSEKVQTGILRNDMGFKGLIVSDAMSMSGLTIYFTQEEAGVRAFLAGTDILEKPADVDAMLRGLRDAAKSGRIPEAKLNESVRKQLAWKYELGLVKQKITPIDSIDRAGAGTESAALTEEIAEKAITLVRDDGVQIPMNKDAKVAVLGISNGFDGSGTMNTLLRSLGQNGVKYTPAYLQENSSPEQIANARKAVGEADVVIAALFGRVRSGARNSVGIPENGAAIMRDLLASEKKVIGVSFGNPYILGSFPQMKTYIVAYGDMSSLQRAVARAIVGTQDITGRLPISLPGLYPRGTGIQLQKKQ